MRWLMEESVKVSGGVRVNEESGVIWVRRSEDREMTRITIYASNPSRRVCVEVGLDDCKGKCIVDGVFQCV